jgi:phosphoglycerol transferase MdoB-like AlkP superfamily enzyme
MAVKTPVSADPWGRSCYRFAFYHLAWLLAIWLILRIILLIQFQPEIMFTPGTFGRVLLEGLHRDCFAGLLLLLPILAWFWMVPFRLVGTWLYRFIFWTTTFVVWYVTFFLVSAEYYFFEEFKSRFNTVAVDYLWSPREVFVNIWESYHVGIVLGACALLTLAWTVVAARLFRQMWLTPYSSFGRFLRLLLAAALCILLGWKLDFKAAHPTTDRTLNEIANNGVISFAVAAWTHHLDYSAYYKTNDLRDSYRRVRRMLTEPNTQFVEEGNTIRRKVAGDSAKPRLNVVLFLEESFGSEFWGCLGAKGGLTPEMDELAAEDGLLFSNLYASGNRTVRGFEGVLSSFPPLPGDSIVKRDLSDDVETIARVLQRDGYSSVFLYGGRGIFDSMRSFALRNGYDEFIEEKHFAKPTFTTIWGVCDEDLMNRAYQECKLRAASGKPFLATILSVSNHKPYTYPRGRIPEDPEQRIRENAVKYSDYALGLFFKQAKKESFWTNTIFVVVADHGARVYGQQTIPIKSYEIPLLIAGPAVVKAPGRVDQLGGSLDVAPTVLALLGRPYETLFFGRDLLSISPEDGRVYLHHNRDIGMLARDLMVVLGLMKTEEFYRGNPKLVEPERVPKPNEADLEIEKDAISIYQVADDLYTHRRYRLDADETQPRPNK